MSAGDVAADHTVIPAPVQVSLLDGPPFVVDGTVRIIAGPDAAEVGVGVQAAERLGRATGHPVAMIQEDDGGPGAVVLRLAASDELSLPADLDPALVAEAYRLEVTADRVTVVAVTGAGLLRGTQTIQLLGVAGAHDRSFHLHPVTVLDYPRFAWRGLTVDLARSFFGLDDLKQVVDLLAMYKLNVLHLHLTDDQGWRLDVPSRPALAAVSGATSVAGGRSGYLSGEDYDQLVTYAAARYVTVVPEIDLPGHVNAALHALGELTPSGEPTRAYSGVDVGFSRLHADLPATGTFLRDVLGDVAGLTPGPWVHIGGDEVLTMEPAEFARLVRAAIGEVRAAGKQVVGWQEVAAVLAEDPPGSADDVVVQYWDERSGAEAVTRAARLGAKVLLSPATKVYLDMRYDEATPVGQAWAGHVEVRDSYDWEPLDVLPDVPAAQVIGVEAAIWTETVHTIGDLFLLLVPRLAAVAEVAWSAPERRDWSDFARRLPGHALRWDLAGLTWYRSPQITWEP